MALWMIEKGCPWDGILFCTVASAVGALDKIQWAVSRKSVDECLSPQNCTQAAQWGYVDMMKWLYGKGLVCTKEDIFLVAKNKHSEMFEWARESGYHWDDVLLHMAAEEGNCAMIEWGRSVGCVWAEEEFEQTMETYSKQHASLKNYMRKKGYRGCVVDVLC